MGTKRICEECGKEVEITFKFCPYCFTDFAEAEELENLEAISSISSLDEDESNGLDDIEESDSEEIVQEMSDTKDEVSDENGNVLFAGKYILLEPLRSSSVGTICRVKHFQTDEKYIMKDFLIDRKVLAENPSTPSQISDTLKKLSALEHPQLLPIKDYKAEKNRLYVFYEYSESTPGIKKIDTELPETTQAIQWINELADLLKYFHSLASPFTPENFLPYSFIFTENEERIKYSLLGLPQIYKKLKISDPFEKLQTETIPPEANARAYDIICFGVTAYYLLTGKKISPLHHQDADFNNFKTIPNETLSLIQKALAQSLYDEPELNFFDISAISEEEAENTAEPIDEDTSAKEWLHYLGNLDRTNSCGGNAHPYFSLLWSKVIPPADIYYLQPWENTLIAVSDKGHIYELDREKGAIIRKKHLNSSTVAPIIEKGIIYINSSSSQSALNLSSLGTIWDMRTKSMFLSPPLLINDKLFTVSYDGFMMSVDKSTGNPETMENINQKVIAALINDTEKIYISSLSGKILGINLETRIVDWSEEGFAPFTSAPVLHKNHIFAGDSVGKIICFDKNTGQRVWETSIKGALAHGPVYNEDRIICSTSAGILASFEAATGNKLWDIDFGSKNTISFCTSGPFVYLSSSDHSLMSMNAESGKFYNQVDLKVKIASTPLFIDGYIYIVSSDGEICAFNVKE